MAKQKQAKKQDKTVSSSELSKYQSGRTFIFKVHSIGRDDVEEERAQEAFHLQERVFGNKGAIVPPYAFESLAFLLENSNSLRQNIDSYVTNIDSFGHRFEPVFSLDGKEAVLMVREAIFIENLTKAEDEAALRGDKVDPINDEKLEPSGDDIKKRLKQIRAQARREKSKLTQFFDFINIKESFVKIRRKTRQDRELMGNAFWEILRNNAGELASVSHVPSVHVRLLPLDKKSTPIKFRTKLTPITFQIEDRRVKFRRFIQILPNTGGASQTAGHTYFKEFGDPRVMSAETGTFYSDIEKMLAKEPNARTASELMHFSIHSSISPYGVPRWIGNLISVMGSRQSEEVNFFYFENKAVPPLALLVSGGRLAKGVVNKIQDMVENHLKGRRNFHKILIIEAETSRARGVTENSGRVQISLEPLTGAQQQDQLFQSYDENNIGKVSSSFRVPKILRGETKDFNRACYSADTETLTETGWKLHHEISPDEKIAAFEPVTGKMVFVIPKAKHVYQVDEELVHLSGWAIDLLVTANHKLLVRSKKNKKWSSNLEGWEIHPASKVPWKYYEVPAAVSCYEATCAVPTKFVLPKTDGCQIERGHNHTSGPAFKDWLEFLGYFISEGSLLTTGHMLAPYLVTLCQKKPKVKAKMRACLDRLGWVYSESTDKDEGTHFALSNRCLRDWLIQNTGTHAQDKKIPWEYLKLDREHQEILFQAMMDGDGSVDHREGRTCGYYATTSSVLAGQMQRLMLQSGRRTVARLREDLGYVITYSDHQVSSVRTQLTLQGHCDVKKVQYQGEVYCYSVPDYGFFITRRNGKIAIQGNTAEAAKIFAEEQVFQPERDDFDGDMNRQIMAALKVRFFKFRSNAPITRDPTKMTKNITDMVKASILTPEEGRFLAEDVFNIEFKRIDEPWVKQPIEVTKAGFTPSEPGDQNELFETEKVDLTTQDLAIQGGLKVPAQTGRFRVTPSIQSNIKELLEELQQLGILAKDATVDDMKGVLARLIQRKKKVESPAEAKKDEKPIEEETIIIQISKKEMNELVERK